MLLRALRPDLRIEPLRGNLDTRLRKLDEGHYAAIVLAAAGLIRLGLGHRIVLNFDTSSMLPAAGQGALGLEVRSDRADLLESLQALAHLPTWLAVTAERAVSRAMGGSCSMPLAAHATLEGPHMLLKAAWGDEADWSADDAVARTPQKLVHAERSASVTSLVQARRLGEQVAGALMAAGAVASVAKAV